MSDYSRDAYGDCARHRQADHASVRKFNMLTHHKCASTWTFERFIPVRTAALPLKIISERYQPALPSTVLRDAYGRAVLAAV
jgi:hypothetical protein